MKKRYLLPLILLMVISLCACGKSENATAVENQITALGSITLESETSIAAAEKAWDSLTEEEKSQVENFETLAAARNSYEQLVLKNAADSIDQEILNIETMKSGKPDAVKAAKKSYDNAAPEVQSLVAHRDQLDAYLANMDTLQAEDAESLISEIGEVTLEKKDSIIAAKKAYYHLPANMKEKVSNADALNDAEKAFLALAENTADETLASMRCVNDQYFPEKLPWSDETSISATDRCFFSAYLESQNHGVKPHILANYTGDQWVFFNQVVITADGKEFTLAVNPFNVKRDDSRESIWEQLDINAGDSDIEMLRNILASKETIITFKGYKYEADYTVSETDRQGIAAVLKVFDCMNASYEINHPGA